MSTSLRAGTTGVMIAAATGTNPAVGSPSSVPPGRYAPCRTSPTRSGRDHQLAARARAARGGQAHLQVRQLEQSLVEVAESVEPAELRRL